jgi:hypothetical protein
VGRLCQAGWGGHLLLCGGADGRKKRNVNQLAQKPASNILHLFARTKTEWSAVKPAKTKTRSAGVKLPKGKKVYENRN